LQDFQVLSYDYLERIDKHMGAHEELSSELERSQGQVERLRAIITESRGVVQSLLQHNLKQKELKEAQWRNIINFDCMKDQEQAKLSVSVRTEVRQAQEMLTALHAELSSKQRMLDKRNAQLQDLERMTSSAENQVCNQRNKLEDLDNEVDQANGQRDEMKRRLVQIENAIRDVSSLCEGQGSSAMMPDREASCLHKTRLHSPSLSFSLARDTGAIGTDFMHLMPGELPPAAILNYTASASPNLTNRGLVLRPHGTTQISAGSSATRHDSNTQNLRGIADNHSGMDDGAQIHSQEVVLGEEPARGVQEISDGGQGASVASPGMEQVEQYQAPLIALDWLAQIKAHVRSQRAQIDEHQSYFDGLRDVLSGGSGIDSAIRWQHQPGQDSMNIVQNRTPLSRPKNLAVDEKEEDAASNAKMGLMPDPPGTNMNYF